MLKGNGRGIRNSKRAVGIGQGKGKRLLKRDGIKEYTLDADATEDNS
ncbi:MAG: hypothetical protein HQK97_10095 [Nitrospirae bacterium]|nr:hypothetical protein [Nitrospirota bacterium]